MRIKKPIFSMDRIVFDRSVWMIYFKSNSINCDENKYDPDLIEFHDLEDRATRTHFKGFGKETVLREEYGSPTPYMSWELRLRDTRSMNVYFNFNRYFVQNRGLEIDPEIILHDDNFLPIDAKITTQDYLKILKIDFPERLSKLYMDWYRRLWPKSYALIEKNDEGPICKCKTLEVARELYPLNVNDLSNTLTEKGVKFTSWNNASNVLHFGEQPKGRDYSDFKIDGTTLKTNVSTWNYKKAYEKVKQSKLYQKAVNLARFEITLYDDQIDFNSNFPVEDIKFTLDEYLEDAGLTLKPMKKEYTETFIHLCEMLKIDKPLLKIILQSGTNWPSTAANRVNTTKLIRKGVIIKDHKGKYLVNSAFLMLYDLTEPDRIKKENTFIPKFL